MCPNNKRLFAFYSLLFVVVVFTIEPGSANAQTTRQTTSSAANCVLAKQVSDEICSELNIKDRLGYLFNSRSWQSASEYGAALQRFAATGHPEASIFGDLLTTPGNGLNASLIKRMQTEMFTTLAMDSDYYLLAESQLMAGEVAKSVETLISARDGFHQKHFGSNWKDRFLGPIEMPENYAFGTAHDLWYTQFARAYIYFLRGHLTEGMQLLGPMFPLIEADKDEGFATFRIQALLFKAAAEGNQQRYNDLLGQYRTRLDQFWRDLNDEARKSELQMERSIISFDEHIFASFSKDWSRVRAETIYERPDDYWYSIDNFRRQGWAFEVALPGDGFSHAARATLGFELLTQSLCVAPIYNPSLSQAALERVMLDRVRKADSIHQFSKSQPNRSAQRTQGLASAYRNLVFESQHHPTLQLIVDWLSVVASTTSRSTTSATQDAEKPLPPLTPLPAISVAAVQNKLPKNTAILEIFRGRPSDPDKANLGIHYLPDRYVAWLIRKGETPQFFDLGPASDVDRMLIDTRTTLSEIIGHESLDEFSAEEVVMPSLEALGNRLLSPFSGHLAEIDHLIICPDGNLWLTPWASLPVTPGKLLIENCAVSLRFTAAELLLPESFDRGNVKPPVIFTNPDFDAPPSAVVAAESKTIGRWPNDREIMLDWLRHGTQESYVNGLAGLKLPYSPVVDAVGLLPRMGPLPFTRIEAETVRPALKQLAGVDPIVYAGVNACEAVLQEISRPEYLIIQSHGYFLGSNTVDPPANVNQVAATDAKNNSSAVPVSVRSPNAHSPRFEHWPTGYEPLDLSREFTRCGLLLAGANQVHQWAEVRSADGIVSALEVSLMDLRGTKIVALSACDTGVGEVRTGEGVASLCQAFQMAGAESVISSLWQVEDASTARTMGRFFENLAKGESRHAALRNAQLAEIALRRKRFGYAHPYFWAAFTLTGATDPTTPAGKP